MPRPVLKPMGPAPVRRPRPVPAGPAEKRRDAIDRHREARDRLKFWERNRPPGY